MLKAELEQAKQLGVCIHSVFIGAHLSSFLLSFLLSSPSTVYSISPPLPALTGSPSTHLPIHSSIHRFIALGYQRFPWILHKLSCNTGGARFSAFFDTDQRSIRIAENTDVPPPDIEGYGGACAMLHSYSPS